MYSTEITLQLCINTSLRFLVEIIKQSMMNNSNRVRLIDFEEQHIETYLSWFENNPQLYIDTKTNEKLTLKDMSEIQKYWSATPGLKCMLIEHMASGSLIGDVNAIHYNSMEDNEVEVNIMIALSEYRRKGYAIEALRLLEEYCKEKMGYHRCIAKIDEDNTSSISFFNKSGYSLTKHNHQDKEYWYVKLLV